jgi:hypothetical protein
MGITSSISPVSMTDYPIGKSIIGKNYKIISCNVFIIYEYKSKIKTLTIIKNNLGELYSDYADQTKEIIPVSGLHFKINKVELIYEQYKGYLPIIYIEITKNKNNPDIRFKINKGDTVYINNCCHFFSTPINNQFNAVSNHLLIAKQDIIKTL